MISNSALAQQPSSGLLVSTHLKTTSPYIGLFLPNPSATEKTKRLHKVIPTPDYYGPALRDLTFSPNGQYLVSVPAMQQKVIIKQCSNGMQCSRLQEFDKSSFTGASDFTPTSVDFGGNSDYLTITTEEGWLYILNRASSKGFWFLVQAIDTNMSHVFPNQWSYHQRPFRSSLSLAGTCYSGRGTGSVVRKSRLLCIARTLSMVCGASTPVVVEYSGNQSL